MAAVRTLESLVLTRHGESTGNVARAAAIRDGLDELDIPDRDADVPLSDLGREQAAALGRWLAGLPEDERPTAVVASPFVRSLETARIALKRLPGMEIDVDERLRDRELGVLFRLTPQGVVSRYPEEAARKRKLGKFYYRPPGGESWADVALRLRAAFTDLDLDHPGGRVLVVAHDAIVEVSRYVVDRLSEEELMEIEKTPIANCSITRWLRRDGRLRLIAYNDTTYLREPGAGS